MAPILRSVVAQIYKPQARNFASSHTGERVVVSGVKWEGISFTNWMTAGFVGYFVWDAVEILRLRNRHIRDWEVKKLRTQQIKGLQLSKERRERETIPRISR